MLSRLSGLASTVLQELSGNDGELFFPSRALISLFQVQAVEPEAGSMEEAPEELLERLAQTEKLVVQLKDLIREKDTLLQQKETVLKEEREAADAKLMKLKLQAKAKLASLNKRIEELTEKGSLVSAQALPEEQVCPKVGRAWLLKRSSGQEASRQKHSNYHLFIYFIDQQYFLLVFFPTSFLWQCQNNQNTSERHREEAEALKELLREREETVQDLKEQLALAKVNLKDAEIKYTTQVQKNYLLLNTGIALSFSQNLRTLQRKLEEQEAALLGRTQVIELLQQELSNAEQQNQTLVGQCQKMEVDLSSLRDVLDVERQRSQHLREKMELELAERKLSSHCLQEEVQCLSAQLEEARRAQAELEAKCKDLKKEQRLEVEEKTLQISGLKADKQELQSSHAALVAENDRLKQDVDRLLMLSANNSATIQKLQGKQAQQFSELKSVEAKKEETDKQLQEAGQEIDGMKEKMRKFAKSKQQKILELEEENEKLRAEMHFTDGEPHRTVDVVTDSNLKEDLESSRRDYQSLSAQLETVMAEKKELKNLQQQYILVGVESAENSHLKAQLQEYQQEADKQHCLQEQLKQESISYQQEIHQLRQEKTTWEKQKSSIKEQYLMVIAEKDKQLSHLQRIMQEVGLPLNKSQAVEEQYQTKISSETLRGDFSSLETETKHLQAQLNDSLKELHQKELRIHQLNSKLSQVFEEKNALSLQLRGSSRNICESHQRYSEVLNRCLALERQLQELQSELFATDAAPGAPQEKNEPQRGSYTPELQELQLSSTKQDMRYLEEQLEEERDRRLAVEEALSAAQDQIRRCDWCRALHAFCHTTLPCNSLLAKPCHLIPRIQLLDRCRYTQQRKGT
uniref:Uncharacterized protein n=1 Tax=Melopsittacus undulatus TaxID=13146 RepID=A0A8V5FRV9_MELUD